MKGKTNQGSEKVRDRINRLKERKGGKNKDLLNTVENLIKISAQQTKTMEGLIP